MPFLTGDFKMLRQTAMANIDGAPGTRTPLRVHHWRWMLNLHP